MRFLRPKRALIGAALHTGFLLAAVDYSMAAPNDYRFELVETQPAGPRKTNVAVRLVHVPDMKPVAGAILLETSMGPAMAEMPANVISLPSSHAELYRFQIETVMAGKWALYLVARVRGEAEPVRGSVTFHVAK